MPVAYIDQFRGALPSDHLNQAAVDPLHQWQLEIAHVRLSIMNLVRRRSNMVSAATAG
jgi:hypothetical protein